MNGESGLRAVVSIRHWRFGTVRSNRKLEVIAQVMLSRLRATELSPMREREVHGRHKSHARLRATELSSTRQRGVPDQGKIPSPFAGDRVKLHA